jgi:cytochrome c biogenesis protein CcdA
MSSDSLTYDDGFSGSDEPLKHPPTILFVLGLLSVVVGILVGAYGIAFADNSTNSKQYIIGSVGYLLTAFTPIVFLQLIRNRHSAALAVNQDEPYDSYAGHRLEKRFLKVVLVGLISAGLSIYVFFLPIAEKFAS